MAATGVLREIRVASGLFVCFGKLRAYRKTAAILALAEVFEGVLG